MSPSLRKVLAVTGLLLLAVLPAAIPPARAIQDRGILTAGLPIQRVLPASDPSRGFFLTDSLPGARPAPGELVGATDLSVAPDGTVYVIDEASGRVQRFAPDGEFLDMWGTIGSSEGEFAGSVDRFKGDELTSRISIGPTGVVFTTDHGRGRFEKFSADGAYYTQWPGNVGDVAIMPDGTVFMTDWGNGQIRNHCPAGSCLQKWGEDAPGRCKPVQRQVRTPIAVTEDDRVVVAHPGLGRVEVCTEKGDLLDEWQLGELVSPEWFGDMALAPDGTLVFSGGTPDHVIRFETDGTFVESWATEGDGSLESRNAQLSVAPSGDVYALDFPAGGSSVIKRFTADGYQLAMWGDKGSAVGQFRSPSGVATAPDGTIVVADTSNGRLQRFGPRGQYIDTIIVREQGGDVRGEPIDVAVGAEGTIYVSDQLGSMVRVFDAQGNEIAAWMAQDLEPRGMIAPRGIAVAPDGTVLVVDELEERVVRFSAEGGVLQTINMGDENQVITPWDVVAGRDGSVYVSHAGGVVRFSADGSLDEAWAIAARDNWPEHRPLGLAMSSDEILYVGVLPLLDDPVSVFALDMTGAMVGQWDVPTSWMQVRNGWLMSLCEADDGTLFVTDGQYDRLLLLDTSESTWSVWDNDSPDAGRLDAPVDVAIAPDYTMYVLDRRLGRVQHIDSDGVSLAQWGPVVTYDSGRSYRFSEVHGVAVASDGRVLVTDSTADIYVFDSGGALLDIWRLGRRGGWQGPLMPAAGPDGAIYVLDKGSDRFGRLDAEGNVVGEWGGRGDGAGQLLDPSAIDVSPYDGSVIVADTGNHRLQWFDADGKPVGVFDSGTAARHGHPVPFAPSDVSVGRGSDGWGITFVADALHDAVIVIHDDRTWRDSFPIADPVALGARHGGFVHVSQDGRPGVRGFGLAPSPADWRLSFFDNPWLAGAPVHAERVESIDHDWGAQAPHETLLPDGWSARFDRMSPEGPGRYDIVIESRGGVRFWLDDHLPVDQWASANVSELAAPETWGPAETRLEFADRGGPSSVRVDYVWTAATDTAYLPALASGD